MGGAEQDADWDDWEEEAEGAAAAPPASVASVSGVEDAGSSEDWGWDMAALEANVAEVEKASGAASSTPAAVPGPITAGELGGLADDTSDEGIKLLELAVAAPAVHQSLQSNRKKVKALSALAKVAKLHLLAVRNGFSTLATGGTDATSDDRGVDRQLDGEIAALAGELHAVASDWAVRHGRSIRIDAVIHSYNSPCTPCD